MAWLDCAADHGVRRALFAAMAGDAEFLATELTVTDRLRRTARARAGAFLNR